MGEVNRPAQSYSPSIHLIIHATACITHRERRGVLGAESGHRPRWRKGIPRKGFTEVTSELNFEKQVGNT